MNHYEELRVCALGQRIRAVGMLLFIQQGMSHWMRCLKSLELSEYRTSPHTNGIPGGNGVAVLLADAALEIAGPVFCIKEEFNG